MLKLCFSLLEVYKKTYLNIRRWMKTEKDVGYESNISFI